MSTIEVDPDELGSAARRLRDVRAAVESDRSRIDGSAGSLGSALVAGRLHDVASNWSQKRQIILDHLAGTATTLECAATAYADTEHAIARGATTSGSAVSSARR